MTGYDNDQARRHIEILRGSGNSEIHFKFFYDVKGDTKPRKVGSFYTDLDEADASIKYYQKRNYGAFVCINPTDGEACNAINVTDYNWIIVDIDGTGVPDEFPLLPSLVTARDDDHGHLYFPVADCISMRDFNYISRLLAYYYNADEQTVDPSRVLRLAGTYNFKNPENPAMYYIKEDFSHLVEPYTLVEIAEAFKISDEKKKQLDEWIARRESNTSDVGFTDDPVYIARYINWLKETAEPAVKGQGRSYHLIKVVGYGYDHGISLELNQELAWEHFNPRCEPPWTEKERDNFYRYVERGYRYYGNGAGCLTAVGVFSDLPADEPAGGWENNAKLRNQKTKKETPTLAFTPVERDTYHPAYVDQEQHAFLKAKVTNKSSVTEQVLLFLGERFPRQTLLKNEKVFYVYDGRKWNEVSNEFIEHEVITTFANWSLNSTKVTQLVKTLGMLAYVKGLQKGSYISTGERANAVIMENGIVEISAEGVPLLKSHDPDFFELNALGYSYNPEAKPPADLFKMLESQWPGSIEMRNQMQEFFGLMLINTGRFHVLPAMIGKSRSGKGVLTKVANALIGDSNITAPTLDGLLKDSAIHALSQAKVAMLPETNNIHPARRGEIVDRLKILSAGDPMQYHVMYEGSQTNSTWPLMVLNANELPDFADGSGALANRIWPFRFTQSFAGREDHGLPERLTTPESISGIFNWAIEGAVRLMKQDKVTVAKESREYVQEFRDDTFDLSSFIEEHCIIDGNLVTPVEDVYDVYKKYCFKKGVKVPKTEIKFGKSISSSYLPVTKKRETSGDRKTMFYGLGLQEIADEPVFEPANKVVPITKKA